MLSANIKLPWEKLDAWAFCYYFFFYECLGIQFFNSHTCGLRDAMPRQRTFTLFTHMWLTGHMPCQRSLTLLFPPNSSASSLTLPWTIARFLDPFYTFNLAHRKVIRDFTPPNPFYRECYGFERTFLLSGVFYFTHLIPREV